MMEPPGVTPDEETLQQETNGMLLLNTFTLLSLSYLYQHTAVMFPIFRNRIKQDNNLAVCHLSPG